jgi:hypothetical protein
MLTCGEGLAFPDESKGEADLRAEPAATGAVESSPKEELRSGVERSDKK